MTMKSPSNSPVKSQMRALRRVDRFDRFLESSAQDSEPSDDVPMEGSRGYRYRGARHRSTGPKPTIDRRPSPTDASSVSSRSEIDTESYIGCINICASPTRRERPVAPKDSASTRKRHNPKFQRFVAARQTQRAMALGKHDVSTSTEKPFGSYAPELETKRWGDVEDGEDVTDTSLSESLDITADSDDSPTSVKKFPPDAGPSPETGERSGQDAKNVFNFIRVVEEPLGSYAPELETHAATEIIHAPQTICPTSKRWGHIEDEEETEDEATISGNSAASCAASNDASISATSEGGLSEVMDTLLSESLDITADSKTDTSLSESLDGTADSDDSPTSVKKFPLETVQDTKKVFNFIRVEAIRNPPGIIQHSGADRAEKKNLTWWDDPANMDKPFTLRTDETMSWDDDSTCTSNCRAGCNGKKINYDIKDFFERRGKGVSWVDENSPYDRPEFEVLAIDGSAESEGGGEEGNPLFRGPIEQHKIEVFRNLLGYYKEKLEDSFSQVWPMDDSASCDTNASKSNILLRLGLDVSSSFLQKGDDTSSISTSQAQACNSACFDLKHRYNNHGQP